MDPAVEHGPGRAPGRRLRRRRGRPRRRHRPLPARAGAAAGIPARARRGRRRACRRPAHGQRAARAQLHAPVQLLRRVCRRAPGARRGLRHDRGGHRAGAHVAGLRRGRQDRPRRGRRRDRRAGGAGRPVHLAGHRLRGHARLRRQPARHRPPQGADAGGPGRHRGRRRLDQPGHGPGPARDLRPRLPALLALPRAAHLHGGLVVVRRGDEVQGPHGRAQPADRVDTRTRQGRPVRQVARERARLVDLAKPVLGQPDPGMEVGRPGIPEGRRVRLVRRAGGRLRGRR